MLWGGRAIAQMDSTAFSVREMAEINLHNGSRIYGELLYYNPLDSLVFLYKGKKITYPSDIVESVVETLKYDRGGIHTSLFQYEFFEKNWYVDFSVYTLASSRVKAAGTQLSGGYRYNQWLSIGGFIAIDNYVPALREIVYPVGIEISGYFLDRGFTPFYKINIGYGFMFNDKSVSRTESRGGILINTAIGLRFTGKKYLNIYLAVGLRLQPAYAYYDYDWSTAGREMYYRRVNVSLGIIL